MAIEVYKYLKLRVQSLRKEDDGATMIEYGLLAALIGVTLIVVIGLLSGALSNVFQSAADELNEAVD
jgi:pilus assembly protein Flp/PilA